jgi:hypothetical protein
MVVYKRSLANLRTAPFAFDLLPSPLNNVHCQDKEGGHKRQDQRKPGPMGEDGYEEGCDREEEQYPVQAFIPSFHFHVL